MCAVSLDNHRKQLEYTCQYLKSTKSCPELDLHYLIASSSLIISYSTTNFPCMPPLPPPPITNQNCVHQLLPPPDDYSFLQAAHKICIQHSKFPEALGLSIHLGDPDLIQQDFNAPGNLFVPP